jgi:hypothetical protein
MLDLPLLIEVAPMVKLRLDKAVGVPLAAVVKEAVAVAADEVISQSCRVEVPSTVIFELPDR